MKRQTKLTTEALQLAAAHALQYSSDIAERRVYPASSAIEALGQLDTGLPLSPSNSLEVIDQLNAVAAPATVATTGGRYFGMVVGGSTPAAMAAGLLAVAWDQVALLDVTSPAALRLERIAARWILELLQLPADAGVGFTTGSSVANMVGLAAARNEIYARKGFDLAESGLAGAPPLRVVLSEQAHVTVVKALGLLGIGRNQLIRVPCDDQGRMISREVPPLGPDTILCLQAGNVNSGASDPFLEIIPPAHKAGAWVHVDGAFGLWAASSPELRIQVSGVELADSWAVDAHKWLNTPYDCGLAISRHPETVARVMSTQAAYIAGGELTQPKDTVPEFSRRARGVEVWAAIREMGRQGVAELIERCCAHARMLANGLQEMGYRVLNDVVLNQVVATIGTSDQIDEIAALVQQEGVCWFGVTDWRGHHAIRLSVSNWRTDHEDVTLSLQAIERATRVVMNRANL